MSGLPLLVSFPDQPASVGQIGRELSWSREDAAIARKLYRRGLPPLANRNCLPYMFGVSRKLISAMGRFPNQYYRFFDVPKIGGDSRRIEAPRRFLKVVQRWIHAHILSTSVPPPYVTGFVRGKNIFDNGRPHANAKNVMVVDIEDFFPSVNIDKITHVFANLGFPRSVAWQLASLCSLEERLPQGAPTSPAIANLAFLPADREFAKLAKAWRCSYTRYADDLAFSGSKRFRPKDMQRVEKMLGAHGFSLNKSKSRIVGAGSRQVVAGLVVNCVPQPPRWKRRLWRAMFHRASKHPREFADRAQLLRGVAAFVNQYAPDLSASYQEVAGQVSKARSIG